MLVSSGTAVLVPQTMLSVSTDVPHTMLSDSRADDVPRTRPSAANTVDGSQSRPPHAAPQTTFSSAESAPQATLVQSLVPGSSSAHCAPSAMAAPSGPFALPHITSVRHAFADVTIRPPLTRRLPQITWPLHGVGSPGALGSRSEPGVSDRASWTAPRAFRNPAPCVRPSYSSCDSAVNCRIAFTRFGVSEGFACSMSAIVPLTTGDAMLVPLSERYGSDAVVTVPQRRISGLVFHSVLPASASDSMPTPGATRSGLATKSIADGPRELNPATVSSDRFAVPLWLEAPTVITHGALPGAPIAPYCALPSAPRPRLPAAETTTRPASTARFAASVSGSVLYDS